MRENRGKHEGQEEKVVGLRVAKQKNWLWQPDGETTGELVWISSGSTE